jgi:hypothetical protein
MASRRPAPALPRSPPGSARQKRSNSAPLSAVGGADHQQQRDQAGAQRPHQTPAARASGAGAGAPTSDALISPSAISTHVASVAEIRRVRVSMMDNIAAAPEAALVIM